MNKGLKMLAVTRSRESQDDRRDMRNDYDGQMRMGGYDMESNNPEMRRYSRDRRGRFTGEMDGGYDVRSDYDMASRFRDRRGREHYDDGRYAPQGNMETRWLPPYYADIDVTRYEYEMEQPETNMQGNYRTEGRGDRNSGRESGSRMEMRGGAMQIAESRQQRNPVGFAARFDSPGKSDASYQGMDELAQRNGQEMAHGGAASHQMPHFDERTAKEWVAKMQNEDGTRGPHWTMDEVKKTMNSRGIKEDPARFYAALNMVYSDFCEVAKKANANTMDFYVDMAKAFLKDKDAGAEDKLASYYEYVVKG